MVPKLLQSNRGLCEAEVDRIDIEWFVLKCKQRKVKQIHQCCASAKFDVAIGSIRDGHSGTSGYPSQHSQPLAHFPVIMDDGKSGCGIPTQFGVLYNAIVCYLY